MSGRTILHRSQNTERALRGPRPRLRGASHLVAALVAWPVGVFAIAAAPAGRPRAAVAAFGLGIAVMFTCSALLHLRGWSAVAYERLFRLDHTGIYLAIGGTGAAVGLIGLDGWPRWFVLAAVCGGCLIGIAAEWLPYAPPRGLNNALYLGIGWVPVLVVPWLWARSGPLVVALLIVGGVLYSVGAAIVGLRRPDPWPESFGYHEVFHVLVILAVLAHGAMIGVLVARVS